MGTATFIAITVVIVVLAVLLSILVIRLVYEKRFRYWREKETENIRRSAISQSRAVLGGRFTEQMVPFFPDFKYDPTEVRFIGSPIDMIVFPGLAKGEPEEIVILEVKSGRSAGLTAAQKKIRRLVENGMVRWDEIHQQMDE